MKSQTSVRGDLAPPRKKPMPPYLTILSFQRSDMGLLITDLATLIAPALLHGAHPRTQRLRIDPQLAANALNSTPTPPGISTSLQRHTRRTLTQLHRILALTKHPKPSIRPKTLSTIPGTAQPLHVHSDRQVRGPVLHPVIASDFDADRVQVDHRVERF